MKKKKIHKRLIPISEFIRKMPPVSDPSYSLPQFQQETSYNSSRYLRKPKTNFACLAQSQKIHHQDSYFSEFKINPKPAREHKFTFPSIRTQDFGVDAIENSIKNASSDKSKLESAKTTENLNRILKLEIKRFMKNENEKALVKSRTRLSSGKYGYKYFNNYL